MYHQINGLAATPLERLRLGEQGVEGKQAAVGMAEQGLPSNLDSVALGDQQFEFVLNNAQKVIGTVRWRRFEARKALAILGVGRVVLSAGLEGADAANSQNVFAVEQVVHVEGAGQFVRNRWESFASATAYPGELRRGLQARSM